MSISNPDCFPIICLREESRKLEEIYRANYFSLKRSSIFEKAAKLESFETVFIVKVEGWIADLRFCSENYDFLIRVPCLSSDIKKSCLNLSKPVIIMRTENSDEDACKFVVDKLVDIFWQEFFRHPVRKRNIGQIPQKVFSKGEEIPAWYKYPAAFFYHLNHGGDPVFCWLAAENELLGQGFKFV